MSMFYTSVLYVIIYLSLNLLTKPKTNMKYYIDLGNILNIKNEDIIYKK